MLLAALTDGDGDDETVLTWRPLRRRLVGVRAALASPAAAARRLAAAAGIGAASLPPLLPLPLLRFSSTPPP